MSPTPGYLSLLARHFAMCKQNIPLAKEHHRITGRAGPGGTKISLLVKPKVNSIIAAVREINTCFGMPTSERHLAQLERELSFTCVVFTKKKLEALYHMRRARTLRDLAAAVHMGYPSLSPNPARFTPEPGFALRFNQGVTA